MRPVESALLVFSWVIFIVFLAYRIMVVIYPQPDAGGVEGNVIYFIQHILDGHSLYTDPELPPYAIAQYTPLYYYLVAAISKLCAVSADHVAGIFITSRVVSLILNLCLVAVIYRIAKKYFEASRSASLIAGFSSFIFLEITSFSRPDSLYHFLFFISLTFFLRLVKPGQEKSVNRQMILFAIFATLTVFAKQTGMMLPVIAAGWFLRNRQGGRFFLLSICFFATLAIGLILSHYAWGIGIFYQNVVLGVANGISPGWFSRIILPEYHFSFGLVMIMAAIALFMMNRKSQAVFDRAYLFILLFVFVLANFAALKYGSTPGYFTEWTILVLIGCVSWLPKHALFAGEGKKKVAAGLFAGVLLLKTIIVISSSYTMFAYQALARRNEAMKKEQQLAEKVKKGLPNDSTTYSVFLNLYTPDSYLPNFLFRQVIVPQMDIVSLASYPQKRYDYSDLRRRLAGNVTRYMILKEKKFEKQFYDISLEHFSLVDSLYGYYLYKNKMTGNER